MFADSASIVHLIRRARAMVAGAVIVVFADATLAHAQQLGYKLLGSTGIDAGVQPPLGLAIIDRVLHYGANELRGRGGDVVPINGLDIDATGMALGASLTTQVQHATFLTFALALPT